MPLINNERGSFPILLAGIGVLLFLLVSLFFPFKQQLLNQIYPKEQSNANENNKNSNNSLFKDITYLSKFSSTNQSNDRTVFITMNAKSQDLKIADAQLTAN